MKDQKLKKEDLKNGGVNPMVVAVAGAVVGAGIAVAGVALSDEKNREKVMKVATTVKDDVVHYVEHTQKQAEVQKKELEKRILAEKEKVKKVVASAKDSLDKTTKEVNNAVKSL
jgi:hypothetical protein